MAAKRGGVESYVILLHTKAEPPRESLSPVVQSTGLYLRNGGIETPVELFKPDPVLGCLVEARGECTLCRGTFRVIVGTPMESQRPTKTPPLKGQELILTIFAF